MLVTKAITLDAYLCQGLYMLHAFNVGDNEKGHNGGCLSLPRAVTCCLPLMLVTKAITLDAYLCQGLYVLLAFTVSDKGRSSEYYCKAVDAYPLVLMQHAWHTRQLSVSCPLYYTIWMPFSGEAC